jgi:cell division protein FtsW
MMFVPPAAAGFLLLVATSDYRMRRIETFFNPYLDPQGAGYHMIQSMTAVAGGAGFGRGLGHGLQKFGYLPEDTTDFLFAIICEELGIAGAAAVVGLYVLLIWAGLSIIRAQQSALLKLLGLGIVTTVGLQALINLAVVTGLGPTKGIALPLVSAGGTGWILTAASLGLLVAMDRSHASEGTLAEPDAKGPNGIWPTLRVGTSR